MLKLDNMKKGIKKIIEKYVTEIAFEKAMANHAEIMKSMLKEIRSIHEDNKHFRESISGLNTDGVFYNRRIENLTIRVEKLEAKS